MRLFGRSYSLVLGVPPKNAPNAAVLETMISTAAYREGAQGLDVSGFDLDFEINRSLKAEPASAKLVCYGLSKDTQKKLGQSQSIVVQFSAGYEGATTLLYLGTCSSVWSERRDAEVLTHIESGDSERTFATARIHSTNAKAGPSVPIGVALQTIVDAMDGVGAGNLFSVLPALQAKGAPAIPGTALHGSATRRLTEILRAVGYGWSIQNGTIQILGVDEAVNAGQSIVCSAATGMIGSPSVDSKGVVSAKMLIIPGLLPGVLVTMDTEFLKGTYKVFQTKFSGSTFGSSSPWYVEFNGKKY